MCDCRVTEELNTFLEEEAQREFLTQTFHDLDIQTCDVCQENAPATEFVYEGICESCTDKGVLFSDGLFESENGDLYAI